MYCKKVRVYHKLVLIIGFVMVAFVVLQRRRRPPTLTVWTVPVAILATSTGCLAACTRPPVSWWPPTGPTHCPTARTLSPPTTCPSSRRARSISCSQPPPHRGTKPVLLRGHSTRTHGGLAPRGAGICIITVTWHCSKTFSQWECSFLWKLRCHWLKVLRQC